MGHYSSQAFKIIIVLAILSFVFWKFVYTPKIDLGPIQIQDELGRVVKPQADKPIIVSFYQTWCSDCVRETPVLAKFAKENNIALYFVSDESVEKVTKFKSRFSDTTLPFYYSNKPLSEYGIKKYPTVCFFDKNGKLVFQKLEVVDQSDLESYLKRIQ
jgi:thiol-disulfide isomerase/thioredoxin